MIGTFAYLILTSARNRVRARIARLRNPRYALALAIGATYIWLTYLRGAHDRPHAGEILGAWGLSGISLLPFFTLGYVAWTWLFGSDEKALAFSEAEVALLFTAPVSRRALVLYRIARSQLPILTTSLVWTIVFRQAPTLAGTLTHVASYWVLLSTLNLNRLGVALVRASGEAHGLRGARRHWIPITVFVVILAMVARPVLLAWPVARAAEDPPAMLAVLSAALSTGSARWALFPFHLLLAPLAAVPGEAWLRAFAAALPLPLAMTVWVLRTDAAFEEAAADASARQARRLEALRARRGPTAAPVRNASRTLPLAPMGAPAVALLWKNAIWLLRTGQLRGLIGPPVVALACVAVFATRSEEAAFLIALVCGILTVGMMILGPMSMRQDLRSELLHLPLLRTFPLRGRDIVMAEVASSALPMAAMQYLLVLVAVLSLSFTDTAARGLTPALRLAAAGGMPALLAGLALLVFLIHNALAVLFPGWVRLGGVGGGVEGIGLGMITLALMLFMLAVLLIVPGIAFAAAVHALPARPALGLFVGALAAGLLMLVEWVACAWALGRSLERVEPMAVEG